MSILGYIHKATVDVSMDALIHSWLAEARTAIEAKEWRRAMTLLRCARTMLESFQGCEVLTADKRMIFFNTMTIMLDCVANPAGIAP